MADKIKLVKGDTKPALVCTITDENTGLPVSISNCSVKLKFRASGAETLTSTITGAVVDGANGKVAFYWPTTALAGDAGDYEGEIEITYADGTVQTVYEILKFKLRQEF